MSNRKSALVCLLACAGACASETGAELAPAHTASATAPALDLPTPAHGFTLESAGVWIDAGDDVRMCEVVELPHNSSDSHDRYYVQRIQSALTAQSDDLVVRAAAMGSETATAMDRGASLPCTRAGEVFGEELSDVLRSPGRYADEQFPADTGKVLQGGQKLAIEYHVVNGSSEATFAKAKLAFHLVDAAQVQHLVHAASFENFTIYTPPNGRSSHVGECRVQQELMVTSLSRRTQRYGTNFKVWLVGGERDGALVWNSANRGDSSLNLAQPLQLAAGEGLRFQCDYVNPTDRELRYGVSAADETCTLAATFWTPDETEAEPAQPEDCLLVNVDSDGVARPGS